VLVPFSALAPTSWSLGTSSGVTAMAAEKNRASPSPEHQGHEYQAEQADNVGRHQDRDRGDRRPLTEI
jgi:hypothetical protein